MLNNRSLILPTDDAIVRRQLRDLDQPMIYFGEGPQERRERLGRVLTELGPEAQQKLKEAEPKPIKDKTQNERFYYEGSEELKKARYKIGDFSLRQCNERLDMARIKQLEPMTTRLIPQQDLIEKIRHIEDLGSYVDEDNSSTELKTLTSCNFNPSASLLATSCRSGKCKLWSINDMETQITLKGHQSNANFITFSPKSGSADLSPQAANLASCAMDGSVNLWNLVDELPQSQLSGPQSWRVTRCRYHPSGLFLATCCSDKSWRLWDVATETELLHQEGHADAVFDIAFHPDGSLAGTASLDSYSRICDLRTGRSIDLLEGHTKGIRTIDFSPDGYHIATGSMDNSVKIWNLRQRKLEYTIPAHVSTVTTVMFEKTNGYHIVSSSFDRTVKFWSSQTWAPLKTLDAYDDRISCFDMSSENNFLASCHFKYIKLWSLKNDT